MWADHQPCSDPFDFVDRNVALSTLNLSEIGAVPFDVVGKFLLATPWAATLR